MKLLWPLLVLFLMPLAHAAQPAQPRGVPLTTPVSGVVKSVLVDVGQHVKKGQALVTLDATVYQARVMEAEAGVERVKEEGLDADRDLARVKELYSRAVSSTTELDQSKLRHARTASAVKEAQARLIIARKNLEDSTLRAPFDGTVTARMAEPGMYVAATLQPPTLIVLAKGR